jgi:hypothetical protein
VLARRRVALSNRRTVSAPTHFNPLVVRGAVSWWTRFPIPLSIRACGLPAHGLQMIFLTWFRRLRVTDSARQLAQPLAVEPVPVSPGRCAEPPTGPPDQPGIVSGRR